MRLVIAEPLRTFTPGFVAEAEDNGIEAQQSWSTYVDVQALVLDLHTSILHNSFTQSVSQSIKQS
jgi:hypothetical protein